MSGCNRGQPEYSRVKAIYSGRQTVPFGSDLVLDDTFAPGFTNRMYLFIQVVGDASGVLFNHKDNSGVIPGSEGVIIDAAPVAGKAGGSLQEQVTHDCPYDGVCSITALTAPVDVQIEVY